MPRELRCVVSESAWRAIEAAHAQTGDSVSSLVERAIADAFGLTHHSIFQVSTSTAVVEGVFGGFVTVADLKRHGDFGLGTFDGLDGELIMVDGECYQASAGGVVGIADDTQGVPFGVVTRFVEDASLALGTSPTFADFERRIDAQRPTENLFVGIRAEVIASHLSLRSACKAEPGEGLVEATRHQSAFSANDVRGTLIGFWTPTYASAINVPGYHFHFVDEDRQFGGHVLGMTLVSASVSMHFESDVHLVLPETAEFLEADLRRDPTEALEITE